MKPIFYRRWFLRIGEFWLQGNGGLPDSDIVRYMHVASPVEGAQCEQWRTLIIALSKDQEQIFKGMDDGTRYEIRRAQARDDLDYAHVTVNSLEDMQEFVAVYESAARAKKVLPRVNLQRLSRMAEAGLLDLSTVKSRPGDALSWHVHVVAGGIARLFYSISTFSASEDQEHRNLGGRANRLHHWLDILRFREVGCDKYDIGGYWQESADAKKRQISGFKRGFGGEEVATYNCMYPRTIAGRVALTGWHVLKQWPGSKV
jgi:lipid II:glycine glycyltransferase (peptidoglycan interpeptide bridge formation enzyme)